jgi:hypothetical protein
MRGGIEIHAVHDDGYNQWCTSGYLAKRTDGSHNNMVVVTAGHCIKYQSNHHSSAWYHKSSKVGDQQNPDNTGWRDNSHGDVGFIDLTGNWDPGSAGSVVGKALSHPFAGSPNPTLANVKDYWTFEQQTVGTPVCRIEMGATLSPPNYNGAVRDCGLVKSYNTDVLASMTDPEVNSCVSGNCKYIKYMKGVNFDSAGGDSGGTVFLEDDGAGDPVTLVGTHVHSIKDGTAAVGPNKDLRGWYTSVTRGLNELYQNQGGINLQPCTTWTPC